MRRHYKIRPLRIKLSKRKYLPTIKFLFTIFLACGILFIIINEINLKLFTIERIKIIGLDIDEEKEILDLLPCKIGDSMLPLLFCNFQDIKAKYPKIKKVKIKMKPNEVKFVFIKREPIFYFKKDDKEIMVDEEKKHFLRTNEPLENLPMTYISNELDIAKVIEFLNIAKKYKFEKNIKEINLNTCILSCKLQNDKTIYFGSMTESVDEKIKILLKVMNELEKKMMEFKEINLALCSDGRVIVK